MSERGGASAKPIHPLNPLNQVKGIRNLKVLESQVNVRIFANEEFNSVNSDKRGHMRLKELHFPNKTDDTKYQMQESI